MELAYNLGKNVYEVWIRNDSNAGEALFFHFRMKNHNNLNKIRVKIVNIGTEKNLLYFVSYLVY